MAQVGGHVPLTNSTSDVMPASSDSVSSPPAPLLSAGVMSARPLMASTCLPLAKVDTSMAMVDSSRGFMPYAMPGGWQSTSLDPTLASRLVIDWPTKLGEGGMGSVFCGTWLGTSVAIKVIHATHGRSSRLGEEARLLSQLRHPCICSIFGTVSIELPSADGTMGSRAAIVLEKLNGGTLAALLHKPTSSIAVHLHARTVPAGMATVTESVSTLDTALACRIARETASGIAFLHVHRVMHRDIKSSNILLDEHLHAKVADFGLAKISTSRISPSNSEHEVGGSGSGSSSGERASYHTAHCGTHRYMAPEVAQLPARGPSVYDHRCDVYSFGVLLWEVMHQLKPFKEFGQNAAVVAVLRGERPPIRLPSERASFVPIIEGCWSQDPKQRPAMIDVTQRLMELEGIHSTDGSAALSRSDVLRAEATGAVPDVGAMIAALNDVERPEGAQSCSLSFTDRATSRSVRVGHPATSMPPTHLTLLTRPLLSCRLPCSTSICDLTLPSRRPPCAAECQTTRTRTKSSSFCESPRAGRCCAPFGGAGSSATPSSSDDLLESCCCGMGKSPHVRATSRSRARTLSTLTFMIASDRACVRAGRQYGFTWWWWWWCTRSRPVIRSPAYLARLFRLYLALGSGSPAHAAAPAQPADVVQA